MTPQDSQTLTADEANREAFRAMNKAILDTYAELSALQNNVARLEIDSLIISEPDMSGAFIGDIWFGHPIKRGLGTHRWDGEKWVMLPSEIESLMDLLATKAEKHAALLALPDTLTDKQIDHASKWTHGWQHMRATDKRNAVRELIRAALNQGQGRNEPVGVTTQWRHKKRGTVYTEIGRGKAQASTEFIADDDDVVIYRGEDGLIWVRQVKEFEDGRFDRLSAAIGERG